MYDICVNIIVRNGEDFIQPVLEAIVPYVKRIRIGIDSRSNDKTKEIVANFKGNWLEWTVMTIKNPKVDLVELRNFLLEGISEKYIWVVDSDELYPKCDFLSQIEDADVYALQCHAPWTKTLGHKASARAKIPRIFKNDGRRWTGVFGKEKLHSPRDKIVDIPYRYIHLTHLKKDNWREEMNQKRVADGRSLYILPEDIIKEINKVYEN